MINSVPALSIAAMAVSLAVCIAIVLLGFVLLNKKTKGDSNCILIGAGTFVVFALVLETILHQVMFRVFGEALTGNIRIYALYGGAAAALFEETGRLITMKLFMKNKLKKENALMFGLGHGGAEAIIVGAMTYMSNIALSVMINKNMSDMLLSSAQGSVREQATEQLSALGATPAYQFLLGGAERVLAFVLQLCLSYIVYRAVKNKKPVFYLLAVFIHFAVDAGLVIIMKKLPVYAVEIILAVMVITIAIITFNKYKAEKEETLTEQ